jgi:hypothetical protein
MLYDGIRLCHHMGDLIGCQKADAHDIAVCILVVLHFIFTFYQLYFLFRNSRVSKVPFNLSLERLLLYSNIAYQLRRIYTESPSQSDVDVLADQNILIRQV